VDPNALLVSPWFHPLHREVGDLSVIASGNLITLTVMLFIFSVKSRFLVLFFFTLCRLWCRTYPIEHLCRRSSKEVSSGLTSNWACPPRYTETGTGLVPVTGEALPVGRPRLPPPAARSPPEIGVFSFTKGLSPPSFCGGVREHFGASTRHVS